MTPKEQYYRYGESLGIKINDLQRLKMLADKCQQNMADKRYTEKDIIKAIAYGQTTNQIDYHKDFINSLNKQD
jgi:hypothetical protein